MRAFTRLFKRLLGIGFEHPLFIRDSWAVDLIPDEKPGAEVKS
jgi:hypothetical protein